MFLSLRFHIYISNRLEVEAINVIGTQKLLRFPHKSGMTGYLHVSTFQVKGDSNGHHNHQWARSDKTDRGESLFEFEYISYIEIG